MWVVDGRHWAESYWHWRRTAVVAEDAHSSDGAVDADNRPVAVAVEWGPGQIRAHVAGTAGLCFPFCFLLYVLYILGNLKRVPSDQ